MTKVDIIGKLAIYMYYINKLDIELKKDDYDQETVRSLQEQIRTSWGEIDRNILEVIFGIYIP